MSRYVVLKKVTRENLLEIVRKYRKIESDLDWSELIGKYNVEWDIFNSFRHVQKTVDILPSKIRKKVNAFIINDFHTESLRNQKTQDDFFIVQESEIHVVNDVGYISLEDHASLVADELKQDLRVDNIIWIFPRYFQNKQYHVHWMTIQKRYRENIKHSVDQEHDDEDDQYNHDKMTGVFDNWVKENREYIGEVSRTSACRSGYDSNEVGSYKMMLRKRFDDKYQENAIEDLERKSPAIFKPLTKIPMIERGTTRIYKNAIYAFRLVQTASKKHPSILIFKSSQGYRDGKFGSYERDKIIGKYIPSNHDLFVLMKREDVISPIKILSVIFNANSSVRGDKLLEEMIKQEKYVAVLVKQTASQR